MPQPKSKASDPFAALDALLAQEKEPTGREWFSVEQFAKRYDYSLSHAHAKLRQLERTGRVKSWKGRIKGVSGTTCKYRSL